MFGLRNKVDHWDSEFGWCTNGYITYKNTAARTNIVSVLIFEKCMVKLFLTIIIINFSCIVTDSVLQNVVIIVRLLFSNQKTTSSITYSSQRR